MNNNLFRIDLQSDYFCLSIFPIAFEIIITNIVCISFHIFSLTTRLTFSTDFGFFD